MKLFIPGTETAEKAEEAYEAIRTFAAQSMGWAIRDRRIRSITFRDRRKQVQATVGRGEPFKRMETVIAIFESNTYLVCTTSKGVLKGVPYTIDKSEVTAWEDFES